MLLGCHWSRARSAHRARHQCSPVFPSIDSISGPKPPAAFSSSRSQAPRAASPLPDPLAPAGSALCAHVLGATEQLQTWRTTGNPPNDVQVSYQLHRLEMEGDIVLGCARRWLESVLCPFSVVS